LIEETRENVRSFLIKKPKRMMIQPVPLVLASGLIGYGAGRRIARWTTVWAEKKNILDRPNSRSSHVSPTPRGGGLGIVIPTLLAAAVALFFVPFRSAGSGLSFFPLALLAGGGALVAGISWLDDIGRIASVAARLIVHVLAAGSAVWALGGWPRIELPFLPVLAVGSGGIIIAVLWIIGLINVYNFMDGIDGLAGIQAVTAGAGWLVAGFLSGNVPVVLPAVIAGSSAGGFLAYNWPPARIFMGDVGSAFLGYSFAVLPLIAARTSGRFRAERLPLAAFLLVSPFVIDGTFTLLRRLVRGERLSQSHRSHLYQRLVISGLDHKTVTLLYGGLGILGAGAGVAFLQLPGRLAAGGLAVFATLAIWIVPWRWALAREKQAGGGKGK
jgi:Fuc2NAc and GlcNAc transferase